MKYKNALRSFFFLFFTITLLPVQIKAFKILNLNSEIKKLNKDSEIGININYLAGDETVSSFVTQLEPGSHVPPHYHTSGIEIYQILSGSGLIKIAKDHSGKIKYDEELPVKTGDFFTIYPGIVHRLENTSEELLTLVVTCAPARLKHNLVEDF